MIRGSDWRGASRCVFLMLFAANSFSAHAVAEPAKWVVRSAESKISFAGTHAGSKFTGEFRSWTAQIRFDPNDLSGSKAVVLVDLSSAATGDQTYDKTLPTTDWFNVGKFAEGRFETNGFTAKGATGLKRKGRCRCAGSRWVCCLRSRSKRMARQPSLLERRYYSGWTVASVRVRIL